MRRLFEPNWAGGWTATRLLFACAALWGHWPRFARVEDAYACTDMLFTTGPWQLANYVVWTPTTAYALWFVGLAGILGLFVGGRFFRPGMILYLLGAWALLAEEAINVKAHDRLSLWVALGLLLSPAHERGLGEKWRSPVARHFLLIVFGWLYWSTGSLKLLEEPGWRDGSAMQYALLHRFHAGGPLALWLSEQALACRVLGWFTVAFEMSFPVLVMWRRSNPWVLLGGAAFHLGVLALMNVGAFSAVALSAYPALLHPEVARGWWSRLRSRVLRPVRQPEHPPALG
ncbi:MAG: HTTM domain-containing protein [Deltaproteobacteria bacterium]|nr:HTTM domain-containing protein [Deltaproteobacteria bacterium]MBM4393171.1 HTTM domain-containing protein [Deltaproteobacteria bacterium]